MDKKRYNLNVILSVCIFLTCLSHGYTYTNPHRDPNICGKPICHTSNLKLNFTAETKYKYKYHADVTSLFHGSGSNASTLYAHGYATIEFITQCDAALSLNDFILAYSNTTKPNVAKPRDKQSLMFEKQSKLFGSDLSKHELRFAFEDGVIAEICPDKNAPTWITNFQRGVLSMFQVTMRRFDMDHYARDTDVNGDCDTQYKLVGSQNSSLVIERKKNIFSCERRYKHHSIIQSQTYMALSSKKLNPVINSTNDCRIIVDNSIYTEITCDERHLFTPLKQNVNSGPTTLTHQSMVLQSEERTSPRDLATVQSRRTLIFDHVSTPKPLTEVLKHSRDMLKAMCQYGHEDAQIKFSEAFTRFIEHVRLLSEGALRTLVNRAKHTSNCPLGLKYVMEALPFVASDASVKMMKEFIVSNTTQNAQEWLVSFSFIPRPSEKMMESMLDLLEKTTSDFELNIATAVHNFCRWNTTCAGVNAVWRILARLEQNVAQLYRAQSSSFHSHKKLLLNIKALGNVGVFTDEHAQLLQTIAADTDAAVDVRVAAIESHRRTRCVDSVQFFIDLFVDWEMDVEVRIAAYLQVMKCPSYLIIQQIKKTLQREEVNQVGSFVWTHLQNLLTSSISNRLEVQGLLYDKDLGRKFNNDARKFSNNFENSFFIDDYNVGGNYELNTIFSPQSYIPRRLTLNLTVDLFGESINAIELDTRVEGFENYLESIFGPNRTFNPRKFHEKYPIFRRKRDNSRDNEIARNLKNVKYLTNNYPKAWVSYKIFGNELGYYAINGQTDLNAFLHKLNPMVYVKKLMSGQEFLFRKAALIMDASYIVPTGIGFPIIMNAAGTTAMNVSVAGLLKARNFMKTGEMSLKGHVNPSAAVDVTGSMIVDAYYASTSIKLKARMHSAAAVEGVVQLNGTQSARMQVKLPKNKTQIFGIETEIIINQRGKDYAQSDVTPNSIKQTTCTWPAIDQLIGLRVCTFYKFANLSVTQHARSNFFFHAPLRFNLYFEKSDPSADIYLLHYKWDQSQIGRSIVTVLYDTPNSKVNRRIVSALNVDLIHRNLSFTFNSSVGLFSARGMYVNDESEKMLRLSMDTNGDKHFDGEIGYKREMNKFALTYYPRFYLGVNKNRVAELSGDLKWVTKKNVSQCDVNIKFETKKVNASLYGYIIRSDVMLESNAKILYTFENKSLEKVFAYVNFESLHKPMLKHVTGLLEFNSTAYPQFNAVANLKYQKAGGHIESKLEINHGEHLHDEKHRLTVTTVLSYYHTLRGTKLNTYVTFVKHATDLDMKVQLQCENAGVDRTLMTLFRYAKNRDIIVTVFMSTPKLQYLAFEGSVEVKLPGFVPGLVRIKVSEQTKNNYDLELGGTWFSGHTVKAVGTYHDSSTYVTYDHNLKLFVKSPSFNDVVIQLQFFRSLRELKILAKATHNDLIYSGVLKYVTSNDTYIVSYGEVMYASRLYSALCTIDIRDQRQIVVEMHLDQLRDIYFALKNINMPNYKYLTADLKWDSNRDSTQRLVATVEFRRPEFYKSSATALVSFPGRTIDAHYKFAWKDSILRSLAHVAWSPESAVDFAFNTDFNYDNDRILAGFSTELFTPFDYWEKFLLNGRYLNINDYYHINGSMYWRHDQSVLADLYAKYSITPDDTEAIVNCSLISTVDNVPSFGLAVRHKQNDNTLIDDFFIAYPPMKRISIKSFWQLEQHNRNKDLAGSVHLLTPFDTYNRGVLKLRMSYTRDRQISGVGELDLDNRHYTAVCDGNLKWITNSSFNFNITTPIERYKLIRGRFGLSEERKHIVAEVTYTSGAIGLEILFQFNNVSNFDIKFQAAAPLDFFKKGLLIAKLEEKQVDFRVGWDAILVGVTGKWFYASMVNFDYKYVLFTPIDGFDESSLVARLALDRAIDLQFTAQLAHFKAGLTVLGEKRSKLFDVFGLQHPEHTLCDFKINKRDDINPIKSSNIVPEASNWVFDVEVSTIVVPSVTGTFELDMQAPFYTFVGTIYMPSGNVHVKDEFFMESLISMKNCLAITTPYIVCNQITSNFDLEIIGGISYLMSANFNFRNASDWQEAGVEMSYVSDKYDDDVQIYIGNFDIHTPFDSFMFLNLHIKAEIDENRTKANTSLSTNSTKIIVNGILERDDKLFDLDVLTHVVSSYLTIIPTKVTFKKDESKLGNSVWITYDNVGLANRKHNVEMHWKNFTFSKFHGNFRVQTPMSAARHLEVALNTQLTTLPKQLAFHFIHNDFDLLLNGTLRGDNTIVGQFGTTMETFNFSLEQAKGPNDKYLITGKANSEMGRFVANGFYRLDNDALTELEIALDNGLRVYFNLIEHDATYNTTFNYDYNPVYLHIANLLEYKHQLQWYSLTKIKSSNHFLDGSVTEAWSKLVTPKNIQLSMTTNTTLAGFESLKITSNLDFFAKDSGILSVDYDLANYAGVGKVNWSWTPMECMRLNLFTNYTIHDLRVNKQYDLYASYLNPLLNFKSLSTAVVFDIDSGVWTMGSNVSASYTSLTDISGQFNLILPKPKDDTYTLNIINKRTSDYLQYLLSYLVMNDRQKYAVFGEGPLINHYNLNQTSTIEWGYDDDQKINTRLALRPIGGLLEAHWNLLTPKYRNRDTLRSIFRYGYKHYFHNVSVDLDFPEREKLLVGHMYYKEFENMNGTFNVSNPFKALPYLATTFKTETIARKLMNRYVIAYWANETAELNATFTGDVDGNGDRVGNGRVIVHVPLTTKHHGDVVYGFKENDLSQDGHATIFYNENKLAECGYRRDSERSENYRKDVVNINVKNELLPLGLIYDHRVDVLPQEDDNFIPEKDIKQVQIYQLNNKTAFNLTGDLHVRSFAHGNDMIMHAHHMNRSVSLMTNYRVTSHQLVNQVRLTLSPKIWLGYDLNLLNNTESSTSESQHVELELTYPRRNVSLVAGYNLSDDHLGSTASLSWDHDGQAKNVEGAFSWRQVSPDKHTLLLELKHPTFEKNISIVSEYTNVNNRHVDLACRVDYSHDARRLFNMTMGYSNENRLQIRNYSVMAMATHPTTKLDMHAWGGVDFKPRFYHTSSNITYKRSYLPLQRRDMVALIDTVDNVVLYSKTTESDLTYFWGKYEGAYPIYRINSTAIYGDDVDAKGLFILDLNEKFVSLDVNRTPDVSQSLRMFGAILDARTAVYDLWRTYDDIRISDVAYYIKLNHSRLITSEMQWRPTLKADMKAGVVAMAKLVYDNFIESIDYWKTYIKSEAGEVLNDVWYDAKPNVQAFLDDLQNLNVLEDDVEQLKVFLNESYNKNEFFMKSIIGFSVYLMDDLAIRQHLESVPNLVNEIWEKLGESGKALRRSIQWAIESIKNAYKRVVQFVNELMKDGISEKTSQILTYAIDRYDAFIKRLQIQILQFMDNLWIQFEQQWVQKWNSMLAAFEPTLLKLIHYLETFAWNATKELLDFLYKRKTELETSPYFNRLSNLTQDLDTLYKDLSQNDVFTNAEKYAQIVFKFFKEKYFDHIPFGEEVTKVTKEIVGELQQLQKLPVVTFVGNKVYEMYSRVKWFYEYFEVNKYIDRGVRLARYELTELTKTALESENKYRQAKTKFIFDPDTGLIVLEQKLPMSWHSFNDTPRLQEIPEIKLVFDVQTVIMNIPSYLSVSNQSLWKMYYQYEYYLDYSNWLPPFDATAMVIGANHFVTFDGRHYDLTPSPCTYLLARDFIDGNFSIYMTYTDSKTHEILVNVHKTSLVVNLFENFVKVQNSGVSTRLPLQIDSTIVYQEDQLITIENKPLFAIYCHMKYDYCRFTLPGWYFGKTAGLLGTINNEPYDDFTQSTGLLTNDVNIPDFANTWTSLTCQNKMTNNNIKLNGNHGNDDDCEVLFQSPVSDLSGCFTSIDANEYFKLCRYDGAMTHVCAVAAAYIGACKTENILLRMPSACITCEMPNGTLVNEGKVETNLVNDQVPKSADVVFIVEAKPCNENITYTKNALFLAQTVQRELDLMALTANRFGLVTFGGAGVFDKPRSVVINNDAFTNLGSFANYLVNVVPGNGSGDVFDAIKYAAKLKYRAGVSKTIILLPCSNCSIDFMKIDYSSLREFLRENDIKLHILTPSDFDKQRLRKSFVGMDATKAYTLKDAKDLKGDVTLRQSIKISKMNFAYCASLAFETNGSIFATPAIDDAKKFKKSLSVFAKRIAQSAMPSSCQMLECSADSNGSPYVESLPCNYPVPNEFDYALYDDDYSSTDDIKDDVIDDDDEDME